MKYFNWLHFPVTSSSILTRFRADNYGMPSNWSVCSCLSRPKLANVFHYQSIGCYVIFKLHPTVFCPQQLAAKPTVLSKLRGIKPNEIWFQLILIVKIKVIRTHRHPNLNSLNAHKGSNELIVVYSSWLLLSKTAAAASLPWTHSGPWFWEARTRLGFMLPDDCTLLTAFEAWWMCCNHLTD